MGQKSKMKILLYTVVVSALIICGGQRDNACGQNPTVVYTYDKLNRLETATYSNGAIITYGYDAAGNRTSVTVKNVEFKADVTPRPAGKKTGIIARQDWDQVGRFAAGIDAITNTSELQRADSAPLTTFGNGKIDVFDWVQAGRFFAGLDDLVPAAAPVTSGLLSALMPSPSSFFNTRNILQATGSRTVRITSPSLQRGQSNPLNLEFDAQGDENAIAFSLNFDPTLFMFVSASTGLADAQLLVNTSQVTNGKVGIVLALSPGKAFAAGTATIALVRFQISSGVTTTTRLFFGDQPTVSGVADVYANSLNATYAESTLTLNGDVVAPTLTSLSPNTINAGSTGIALTVNGTGFVNGATVQWNGQNRTTTFVSSTQLTANILTSDLSTEGVAKIKVVNPTPPGGTSNELTFTVTGLVPSLVSISPTVKTQGDAAFTLTLNGANFLRSSVVRWNGADRPTTFISSTQLQAAIPGTDLANAGTAFVTVYNAPPSGGTTTAQTFTINPLATGYEADVSPRPNGNNNGTVTIADWTQMGRFVALLDSLNVGSEFQRADCAPKATLGDGKITLADWVQAGRFAAGLDPVLPAGGPSAPVSPLALTGIGANVQPEAGRILRAVNSQFMRGQIGTLQIELDAQGNENATAFSLNFDPKQMSFVDANVGNGATGAALQVNRSQATTGKIGIALALPGGQQLAAGTRTLLTVRFIPGGNEGDVVTNITFTDQLLAREVVDAFATPIESVSYTNSAITVSGRAAASVSAANYVNTELAADSISSAFGTRLSTLTVGAASNPLPTTLGGTTVKVKDSQGVERLAALFFVSPNQVNYQIPAETAEGIATVTIVNSSGEATPGLLNVSKIAPGIFSADSSGQGWAAGDVVYVKNNGAQVIERVARFDAAQNQIVPVPIDVSTDTVVLVLYGTGLRYRSNLNNVIVKIGGVDAVVEYADKQGQYVGLDQINVRVPKSLAGRGAVNVEISVEGKASNPVRISLR